MQPRAPIIAPTFAPLLVSDEPSSALLHWQRSFFASRLVAGVTAAIVAAAQSSVVLVPSSVALT